MQYPYNPDLLNNLGPCYVNLGQLNKGMELLHRCIQLAPALSRLCSPGHRLPESEKGRSPAGEGVRHAGSCRRSQEPCGPQDLGAIFGKEGDSLKALYYLRQSYEIDPPGPRTVYSLAFAYTEPGDIEMAQKHFQMVLETAAPEDLRGLARKGLLEIASPGLMARGRGWTRSSIRLGAAALSRGVAGGGPGRCHSRSG